MTGARGLAQELTQRLVAAGELAPDWVEAFLAVPRHAFLPDVVWRHDPDGERLAPLRRASDPADWLALAYANDAVATQVDDGHPGPGLVGRESTSSASQPSVVAIMLAALAVAPGMSVCEIGTGTGWNAGLLAYRLGSAAVTSIEVDAQLAARAQGALSRAGFGAVTVVHGDGADGYPARAPYDRVVATAAVYEVPYAWVAQTRPGGLVLAPWRTEFHPGELLLLRVGADGTACGHAIGSVAFMTVRAQRRPRADLATVVRAEPTADRGETDLHPHQTTRDRAASFAIGLRVPRCHQLGTRTDPDSGAVTTWFADQHSRSWAAVTAHPDASTHLVQQHGPRRLWDEIHAAYTWWQAADRPAAPTWRVTVTPTGQHATR